MGSLRVLSIVLIPLAVSARGLPRIALPGVPIAPKQEAKGVFVAVVAAAMRDSVEGLRVMNSALGLVVQHHNKFGAIVGLST